MIVERAAMVELKERAEKFVSDWRQLVGRAYEAGEFRKSVYKSGEASRHQFRQFAPCVSIKSSRTATMGDALKSTIICSVSAIGSDISWQGLNVSEGVVFLAVSAARISASIFTDHDAHLAEGHLGCPAAKLSYFVVLHGGIGRPVVVD